MSEIRLLTTFARAAGLPELTDPESWKLLAELWRKREDADFVPPEVRKEFEEEIEELKSELETANDELRSSEEVVGKFEDELREARKEVSLLTEHNKQWSQLIDKLSLAVPSVEVGHALANILKRCDAIVPRETGPMLTGQTGPEERWHSVLRAIRNEVLRAQRAITSMKPDG